MKSFSIGKKLIDGHTLHFVPSMTIGYAMVLDGLCISLLSRLKKISVHSFHYPDRRDGPSGFKRSEESDSVFFSSPRLKKEIEGVLAYARSPS